MNPKTIDQKFDTGKIAQIQCVKNDKLSDLDIKDKCFLLAILYEGEAKFEVGDRIVTAQAPCLVCFDERNKPKLISKHDIRCNSIYFHPKFFNINLTFERIHNEDFREVAFAHNLFLMEPFTDKTKFVFPLSEEYITGSEKIFDDLTKELSLQTDFYWSCRSRTYFIQLIFLLERIYGMIGREKKETEIDRIKNDSLKKAVMFIEGHYPEKFGLSEISKYASINHTTLTRLFKSELSMTPIEYLWFHRIKVAKKQLCFTQLPIKEIAIQCGFKTLQHFSRKFEESTNQTPSNFRKEAFNNRIAELNNYEIKRENDLMQKDKIDELFVSLKNIGFTIDNGLSKQEISEIEEIYGFKMPKTMREFFQKGCPREVFLHWHDRSHNNIEKIKEMFEMPRIGIVNAVLNHGFWLEAWGKKPSSPAELKRKINELYKASPKLIPIFHPRYLEPNTGYVLSIVGQDSVVYADNMISLIKHDILDTEHEAQAIEKKHIPFWKDVIWRDTVNIQNKELSYETFRKILRSKKLGELCFRFSSDPPDTVRFLGSIVGQGYWAGYCDISDGYTCETADEIINAKIFDGKSLKERWGEFVFIDHFGISFDEWQKTVLPQFENVGTRKEFERDFHRLLMSGGNSNPELPDFYEKALAVFPNDEIFMYRRLTHECFRGEKLLKDGSSEEGRELLLKAYRHGKELLEKCPDDYSAAHFILRILNDLGMKEKISELCLHSPDEFEALVKKGRGEAVLWLREEKHKGFFVQIIKSAIKNDYRYDSQCSDDQAEYIHFLVRELEHNEDTVDAAFWNRRTYGEDFHDHEFSHYVKTLSVFAKYGYSVCKTRIFEYYELLLKRLTSRKEQPAPNCGEYFIDYEYQDFCNTAISAVHSGVLTAKDVIYDIGEIFSATSLFDSYGFDEVTTVLKHECPDFDEIIASDDTYISLAAEKFKKSEEISKKAACECHEKCKSFDVSKIIKLMRAGEPIQPQFIGKIDSKKLDGKQFSELSELVLASNDLNIKWLILRAVDKLAVSDERLVEEAKKYEYALSEAYKFGNLNIKFRLARVLIKMLGSNYSGQACIRDYAKELKEKGVSLEYRVDLALPIMAKDDKQELLRFVKEMPIKETADGDIWHTVHLAVLDMWEQRCGEGLPAEILYHIYDTTLCASCRQNAVRLMLEHNCLPESIKEACVYDSEEGTRALVTKQGT